MTRATRLVFLILTLAALGAGAQTAPPPAGGGTSAASTAAGKAASAPVAPVNTDLPAGRVSTPDVTNAIKSEVQARGEGAPVGSAAVSLPHGAGGRRDPFLSPIVVIKKDTGAASDTAACGSGKSCLVPDLLTLKGIVKSREGMIAMVENQQQKSYVLHEHDQVYRGSVLRITGDSVVFRQSQMDSLGHYSDKIVVKKVSDRAAP